MIESFLTVVVDATEQSARVFEEVLLALEAQLDQSFDVVVLIASDDSSPEGLLARFDAGFSQRVSVVEDASPTGAGLLAPSRSALFAAQPLLTGEYVAFLSCLDLPFGGWVQSLHTLAARSPGCVLRLPRVDQEVVTDPGQAGTPRAVGPPQQRFAAPFDLLAVMVHPEVPPGTCAIPRQGLVAMFSALEGAEAELFGVELLVRCVLEYGLVEDTERVGLLARHMRGAAETDSDELSAALARRLDQLPLRLPVGSASRLRELIRKLEWLVPEYERMRGDTSAEAEAEASS